jgi:hypothetical protein
VSRRDVSGSILPEGALHRAELGTDVDQFMLHIYAAFAEKECRLISEWIKARLCGKQIGGIINAQSFRTQTEAIKRAEALRPVLTELVVEQGSRPTPWLTISTDAGSRHEMAGVRWLTGSARKYRITQTKSAEIRSVRSENRASSLSKASRIGARCSLVL